MRKEEVIQRLGPAAFAPFVAAFKKFAKDAQSGRQATIRIRNSTESLRLAWRIAYLSQWIDANLQLPSKRVPVPNKFLESWDKFNHDYREPIRSSRFLAIHRTKHGDAIVESPTAQWLERFIGGDLDAEVEKLDGPVIEFGDPQSQVGTEEMPPSFDEETEFEPGKGNPVQIIERALDFLFQSRESDEYPYPEKALDAWGFLKDGMGLDTDRIWARWLAAPQILSAHIENPSIAGLYDEAIRCFAFGQFAAAMAMCRATLELVLDRLYGAHGDGLKGKVLDAQRQYGELRGYQLMGFKDSADDVLHNPTKWISRTGQAEDLVLKFLAVLKALVEGAKRQA